MDWLFGSRGSTKESTFGNTISEFARVSEEAEEEIVTAEESTVTLLRNFMNWLTPAYILLVVFLFGIIIACAGIYSFGEEGDEKLDEINEKMNLLIAENARTSDLVRTLQYEIAVTGDCSSGPPTVGCILFEFYFYYMFAQRDTIVTNEEDIIVDPQKSTEEVKRLIEVRKNHPVASVENTGHHPIVVPAHRLEIMETHKLGKELRLTKHAAIGSSTTPKKTESNEGTDDLQL